MFKTRWTFFHKINRQTVVITNINLQRKREKNKWKWNSIEIECKQRKGINININLFDRFIRVERIINVAHIPPMPLNRKTLTGNECIDGVSFTLANGFGIAGKRKCVYLHLKIKHETRSVAESQIKSEIVLKETARIQMKNAFYLCETAIMLTKFFYLFPHKIEKCASQQPHRRTDGRFCA